MDAWQMQCCGIPFEVGSQVAWTLLDNPDRAVLRSALGPELAASITHFEEHHGGALENAPVTTGRVRAIQAVSCRYAPTAGSTGNILFPVEGSATTRGRRHVDGWEPEAGDARFVGYLVEIDDG